MPKAKRRYVRKKITVSALAAVQQEHAKRLDAHDERLVGLVPPEELRRFAERVGELADRHTETQTLVSNLQTQFAKTADALTIAHTDIKSEVVKLRELLQTRLIRVEIDAKQALTQSVVDSKRLDGHIAANEGKLDSILTMLRAHA